MTSLTTSFNPIRNHYSVSESVGVDQVRAIGTIVRVRAGWPKTGWRFLSCVDDATSGDAFPTWQECFKQLRERRILLPKRSSDDALESRLACEGFGGRCAELIALFAACDEATEAR